VSEAERLNADCQAALLDRAALQRAMHREGELWRSLVTERCQHLFADVPVFITAVQMRQMREVIDAVERVVMLPGWGVPPPQPPLLNPLPQAGEEANVKSNFQSLGVFFGYDFHLNSDGAHLIEINSNAGGGFLNALLLDSQRETAWPGEAPVHAEVSKHGSSPFDTSGRTDVSLNNVFLEMFRNEWRLERGEATLHSVAIVDEQPEAQYLYPEFLLAQRMFERAGIAAYIADPAALHSRDEGVYLDGQKIDLVYNRLTDFSLQQHPVLRQAYLEGSTVVTPGPAHYARYADKRNLARLTDAEALRTLGASETDIAILQAGVPQTRLVEAADQEQWWQERKQWFFKPATGFGSKGSYSGAKLTHRVFEEIMRGGYVAQRMAAPGERMVCAEGAEPQPLKYDVRCYVYDGRVQLVAARLYQGQTTNFRTPGGGFAPVCLVE
jgi:hypothetical protein